jgi:hypothetical protein
MSDINTAVVDSLKVLDLKWPIREADINMTALSSLSGQKATSARLRRGRTPPLPVMVAAVNFQESRSDT